MKILVVADIHLSGFENDTLGPDGLPWKLEVIMNTLHTICNYAIDNSISTIVIAGDIINDKSIIYTEAQDEFRKILIKYKMLTFIMISGNHDLSKPGQLQASAISVFNEYSNTLCITKPEIHNNITYIPFSYTIYDDISSTAQNDILISHFGLNEATLQSGISVVTNVKMSDLKKFKLVVLGHYHKPQFIQSETTRLYYTGSLSHRNWNDKNEQKRFLIVDTETLEVESKDLLGFKEFREYIIHDPEQLTSIIESAERDRNNGHEVRVINNCKVKINNEITSLPVLEKPVEIDPTNRGIDLSQSKKDRLYKYLQIKGVPPEHHDEYFQTLQTHSIVQEG